MTPSNLDPVAPDRQPRVRRVAGLVAAGAVVVTAAVALPAMAATTDPQPASSSETTITANETSTSSTSTTAAPTTSTTASPPSVPSAEELLAAQLATYTPEQKLAFDLYVASPAERAAWSAYITPPPPPPPPPPAPVASPVAPPAATSGGNPPNAFLACVRQRESGGNYSVSSGDGLYRGAYQFHQSTWNNTASHAGRGDLVGADPASVSPADQDAMAAQLYAWQGSAPWGGGC